MATGRPMICSTNWGLTKERVGPHFAWRRGLALTNKPAFGLQVQHAVGEFPGAQGLPPSAGDGPFPDSCSVPRSMEFVRYPVSGGLFLEPVGGFFSVRNCARRPGIFLLPSHAAGEAFGAAGVVRGWAFSPAEDAGDFHGVCVGSSPVTVVLTVLAKVVKKDGMERSLDICLVAVAMYLVVAVASPPTSSLHRCRDSFCMLPTTSATRPAAMPLSRSS